MGGRVPLETMLKMADVAGYVGRILGLSWKEQSEPESVIGGYAEHQKNGLGPVSPNQIFQSIDLTDVSLTPFACSDNDCSSTSILLRHSSVSSTDGPSLLPDFALHRLMKCFNRIASTLLLRLRNIIKVLKLDIQWL